MGVNYKTFGVNYPHHPLYPPPQVYYAPECMIAPRSERDATSSDSLRNRASASRNFPYFREIRRPTNGFSQRFQEISKTMQVHILFSRINSSICLRKSDFSLWKHFSENGNTSAVIHHTSDTPLSHCKRSSYNVQYLSPFISNLNKVYPIPSTTPVLPTSSKFPRFNENYEKSEINFRCSHFARAI